MIARKLKQAIPKHAHAILNRVRELLQSVKASRELLIKYIS